VIWLGAAVVVVLATGAYFMIRRGGGKVVEAPERFDLGRMFEEHPHLRVDDKEVLRFIAESGGEIFAAELRARVRGAPEDGTGVPRRSGRFLIFKSATP
jgi:uncharacterized membrane protein